jgi:glucosamine--fructose-6-phosphate aminotransferase (isomerizing)
MEVENAMGLSQLHQEIHEQPEALARLLAQGRESVEAAARRIADFDPQWVVIAARGTSDNAARYAKYLFGAHNRMSVGLAVPSLHTLYDAPPRLDRALTIGISQSGRSPDIVSVVEEARRQGGAAICISNDSDSPLAQVAEHCIPLLAGEEKSVAATKTYTTSLLSLAMLSTAMKRDEGRWDALRAIPGAVRKVLEANPMLFELTRSFSEHAQFLVLGRGFNYCTAFEIALKIKETSYAIAEPYSSADLLHGPVAMVDESMPIILVAPSGRTIEGVSELLDLFESRGAPVIAISDRSEVLLRAHTTLRLPAGVPEWLSPIVSVVPGQLWAKTLATAKGLDPDRPRGLSKVTLTH